jgi:hypothetical protein
LDTENLIEEEVEVDGPGASGSENEENELDSEGVI